jgi:hypothetical protein
MHRDRTSEIRGQCTAQSRRPSIETRSLPTLTRSYPRRFTFYVADPISSIVSQQLPAALDGYLTALPAMSLIPVAPVSCELLLPAGYGS